VVIDNYPEGKVEQMEAINNPEDPEKGKRNVPFSKTLLIERDDFMEDPPSKFFRLAPGREVRLRSAYIIRCESFIKDPHTGTVTEIHCTYDPLTRSGMPDSNRKVKGTLHWVSEQHAITAEIRLYDRLFIKENPDDNEEGKTYIDMLNPDSLKVVKGFLEPAAAGAQHGEKFQFERIGYFSVDDDSKPGNLVFNRAVSLKDSWTRTEKFK
ncbi:MAG TPA: glutamine--tRNA ligase, partial [Bacteroidales bacterium]|nr:glutamine--tRNA ligase [Bacteroidales bacterium]